MSIFPGLGTAQEHLDPGTRMGEILFGLIMTLTFTLGAGLMLEQEGREGARSLLVATIGCNIAWGLIDGVFYVLGRVFERGRRARIAAEVRSAGSPAAAERRVAAELDGPLSSLADETTRQALYASIARRLTGDDAQPGARVTRSDLLGDSVLLHRRTARRPARLERAADRTAGDRRLSRRPRGACATVGQRGCVRRRRAAAGRRRDRARRMIVRTGVRRRFGSQLRPVRVPRE
jgi:hypothetical protein